MGRVGFPLVDGFPRLRGRDVVNSLLGRALRIRRREGAIGRTTPGRPRTAAHAAEVMSPPGLGL